MRTVALFGGSFNPPHVGHTLVSLYVLQTAPVDEVWWVPAWKHAFDKPLETFERRYEMARLAVAALADAVRVSRIEEEIGGESRTVVTLRALHAKHADVRFRLVMGSDLVEERERWLAWQEIERLAAPIYVAREGFPSRQTAGLPAMPAIASRDLRQRLRLGDDVSALVPRAVLDYINAHRLYQEECK